MTKKDLTSEEIAEKEKEAREAERKEKEALDNAKKEAVKKIREQAMDKKTVQNAEFNELVLHCLKHFYNVEVVGEIATNVDDLIIYYNQKRVTK
jgi:hypothetical protein